MCSLQSAGYNIRHVWSSPYRRCLQTAGVACRQLGVDTVRVHHGLGEVTRAARSCAMERGVDPEFIFAGGEHMYLTGEGKAAAVGAGLAHMDVDTTHFVDRSREDFHARV